MVALSAPAYVAVSHVVTWLNPNGLALARTAIAAAALGVFLVIRAVVSHRPILRTIEARHWPRLILLGTLGFTGYSLLLAIGQRTVAAGTTSLLLNFSSVLTVIIGALFLGERRRFTQWIWIAGGFAGTALTVMGGNQGEWSLAPDALWILGSAAALTAFVVIQQPMLSEHDPIELTFGAAAGGLVSAAALIPWVRIEATMVGPAEVAWVIVLGVAFTGAAYAAWAIALRDNGAGNGALLMILLPAITMGLDLAIFGRIPSLVAVLGGVLTMVSVWLATRRTGPAELCDAATPDGVTVTVPSPVPVRRKPR